MIDVRPDFENKSIIFSEVELRVGYSGTNFLASGLPDQYDIEDLDEFIEYAEGLDEETNISVSVRSYSVGRGESDNASDSELEYIKSHEKELEDEYGIDIIQSEDFSVYHEHCEEYED